MKNRGQKFCLWACALIVWSGGNPTFAQDRGGFKPFGLHGLAVSVAIGGGLDFGGQSGEQDFGFDLGLIFPSAGISPRLELSGDFQAGRFCTVQLDAVSGPTLNFGGAGPATSGGFEQYTSVDESGAMALGTLSLGELGAGGLRIDGRAFTPAGLGGAISQYAQSPSANGAALLALATSWNGNRAQGTAAVYAVVMDDAGTLFLGSGDVNATLRHELHQDFDQRHQSFKLMWPLGTADSWVVFARIGPWVDHMTQRLDQTTVFSIMPTVQGAAMPTVAMVRADQSRTRSTALTLGLGAERPISASWRLAAYIDLGKGSYENRHAHTGYSAIYSDFPEITVDQPVADVTERGTARLGQIGLQMIREVDAKSDISFGLTGDYHGLQPWLRPTSDGQTVMGHASDYGWGLSVKFRHWF